jgi:hypothetical protein
MRLLLVSEGALDVGGSTRTAHLQKGQPDDAFEQRGAVGVLVKRLLEEKFGRELHDWEIESDVLPRVHDRSDQVSGYERKVCLAIGEADARGCSSVAVVVDRDRTEGGKRLAALRGGRAQAEQDGNPLAYKTALGVAIEAVEAWLLADEKALNEVLDPHPAVSMLPDPEGLNGRPGTDTHPKRVFKDILSRARTAVPAPYDEVAKHLRIHSLTERCSLGFAPFAEEVRSRCE